MSMNLNSKIESLATNLLSMYEAVEAIVGQIESSESAFSDQVNMFDKLGASLQEIKIVEGNLSESKERADSDGVVLTQSIHDCVEKTVQIVRRLIPRLAALETTAKQFREAMGPEIVKGVRAIEMQTAYTGKLY